MTRTVPGNYSVNINYCFHLNQYGFNHSGRDNIPAWPFTSYAALGNLLNLVVPQFPHL